MRYIALVDGNVGAYGVVVPDLPGCTSAGPSTDEALPNAVEAVRLWVEDAIDDGEALPPPRTVEVLRADPEIAAALAAGAVLGIVPLVLDAPSTLRDWEQNRRHPDGAARVRKHVQDGAKFAGLDVRPGARTP
jgi:predicted RNase H-like HicB family nuclease